jgi:protein O-mannosyl-transferase
VSKIKKGPIPIEVKKPGVGNKIYIYGTIVLTAFLLYANTIGHNYALDDAIVIKQNQFTKEGVSGIADLLNHDSFTGFFGEKKDLLSGGRYRPLSMISFAIEYQFFGLNPHISHLINIIFYALTGLLIFIVLSKLLVDKNDGKWFLSIPFIASLLFIVHPLHTEAIANIKGRDEIFAMMGGLGAIWFSIKYSESKKIKFLWCSAICLFLGLMSKENTVAFIAIVPLSLFLFRNSKIREYFVSTIPLVISFIVFYIIRQSVLGEMSHQPPAELMNNPFAMASIHQKYATIFYTLGLYLKLLFIPHPLTFDYYPYHIALVKWNDYRAYISLLLYFVLFIGALFMVKRYKAIGFGILYYLITLFIVSNLLFPIGTFMNERFLYMPSLGFCIILAFIFHSLTTDFKSGKRYLSFLSLFILGLICLLFSIKTISRNRAWKDDFTLFTTDVKTSSESAKSNTMAGGALFEAAQKPENAALRKVYLETSLSYLEKAVKIYPEYSDALLLLGNVLYEYHNIDSAMACYLKILNKDPKYELVYGNINAVLSKYDDPDRKIAFYENIYRINPDRYDVNYNLGLLYGKQKNDLVKSIFFLEKALVIKPDGLDALKDIGVAYGFKGNYVKSAGALEKAVALEPNNPQLLINLAITFQNMGNRAKAKELFEKAKALQAH